MQTVEYIERNPLDGWVLEVKVDQKHLGNIRRTRNGATEHVYAYYPGQFNQLTILHRSATLQGLKDDLVSKGYNY